MLASMKIARFVKCNARENTKKRDYARLFKQRTAHSIIRDNVPEEVLLWSSCSPRHAAGVHGNG